MIDTATLTIRIPKSVLAELQAQADRTGRGMDELVNEGIAGYLDLQARQAAAIAEANAEGDGPWVANEDVMRWLESWETPNELPPPQ